MNDSFDMGGGEAATRTEVDPRVYLRALWRWKWIFLVIVVAIPVTVYVVVSREKKVYQSSALLEVQPVSVDASQFSAGGAPSSTQVLNAAAALITTTPVANQAAKQLPPPRPSGRSLLRSVSANANTSTGFITVTATAHSPERAAAVANAFASAVAVTRAQQAVSSLNNAIAEATQELQSLPRGNRSARSQLKQQIQQDKALRVAQGSNAQVLQSAVPVPAAVSPRVKNAVLLGLVAAVLLGLVAVVLAEVADRRLRNINDLEDLADSPTIGVIPAAAFSSASPTVAEREAFHTLRAALTYFNVDRPRRSIVVASPGKGDGKTTVAIQLAIACARAGGDVILIDADLRHPQLAGRMGLRGAAGLPSVLAGNATLESTLVSYELEPVAADGRLRVLASSEIPPNPAQLLASRRMHELLEHLPDTSDIVILDTSPALLVADSFPLFKAASGTLLIARLDHSYKAAIERLAWTIRHAGGTVLGTVVTGADSRDPTGRYAYGLEAAGLAASNGAVANGVPSRGRLAKLLRRNNSGANAEAERSEAGSPL